MNRWKASATLVAILALLLSGCQQGAGERLEVEATASDVQPKAPSAVAVVLPACPKVDRVEPRRDGLPALSLPCLGEGPDVRLSDLRGMPTVLNVWAAWCTNCDREMPLFSQLQKQGGSSLRVFGVHYKAPRAFGLRSARDFGVSFPSVHDEDGDETTAKLGAPGPPTTLFVTADGVIAGRKIGEIKSFSELSRLVQSYLGVKL